MSGSILKQTLYGRLRKWFRPHAMSVPTLEQMMVPNPVCVNQEASLTEAIGIIDERGFDQLPVVFDDESKRLAGALTSRQIAIWARDWASVSGVTVGEAMEAPWDGLDGKPQDEMSDDLLDYFSTHDFVVVVDDQKRVIGIVQLWDIARDLWNARSG